MRLTTKGRFAVTAMVDLGMRHGGGPVTLAEISRRQKISLSYLEQLFGKLRRNGLVDSVRGPGGDVTAIVACGSGLHALLRGALTEDRVDPLHELAGAERLRDVVVRANLEPDLLVDVAALRRQEDDGHVLGGLAGLAQLSRFMSV